MNISLYFSGINAQRCVCELHYFLFETMIGSYAVKANNTERTFICFAMRAQLHVFPF